MPDMQTVTAEAICSALYNLPFSTFVGELPNKEKNEMAVFRLGEKPKSVLVQVIREPNGIVCVRSLYMNYSGSEPLMGDLSIRLLTSGQTQAALNDPTTQAVVRVLEVYRDVLEETGVAGPIEELAPESNAEETEEDMAATDEEAGRE